MVLSNKISWLFLSFLRFWYRSRIFFLIGGVCFVAIVWLVDSLFSVEGVVRNYTLELLILMGILVCVSDVVWEWRSYQHVLKGQEIECRTATESVLQKKLLSQIAEFKLLKEEEQVWQEELEDYYTLWAHQMKIPIAASQLLVEDLGNEAHKQQLQQELFKIEQYTGLVMNYLRLQSFHEDLLLEEQDLAELVRASVKKFSLFFIYRRISLELGDVTHTFVTDKKWFCLLLEQCLSNAVKYTSEGRISIFLEGEDLLICDTGIGIAKEDLERIFERGFSGYNGRLTQQSSGLGLYLSRKIATELGHEISLTSKVGEGTQVRISLGQERLGLE